MENKRIMRRQLCEASNAKISLPISTHMPSTRRRLLLMFVVTSVICLMVWNWLSESVPSRNKKLDHREKTQRSEKVQKNKPGELGVPVLIKADDLSEKELQILKTGWELHGFNEVASIRIALNRGIPDFRPFG